jgi:sulfite reductase (ferredoxin)
MYKLPASLTEDIKYTASVIDDFQQGHITKGQFKAVRVPMGIYEQRIDGQHMVRIRCSGGYISPAQLHRLAEIGKEANTSHIHITTRQELQLHRIDINDTIGILKELQSIGLGTQGGGGNTVRNMLVDVRAGISDAETFDPYPYAVKLTSMLIAEKDSFSMPRKLKIAFDISEAQANYALINDLGFIPVIKNGERGFKVFLGGSVASNPTTGWLLFDFLPTKDLYRAAEAAKQFFNANGNRKNRHKARIRYIFYKYGEKETRRRYFDFYDRLAADPTLDLTPAEINFRHTTPPFAPAAVDEESYGLWRNRYALAQKQKGMYSLMVPFVHGNNSPDVFIALADFASAFGDDTIRFTTRQDMQLRNIPEAYLPNVYQLLKSLGFTVDLPVIINNLSSCTGADTCRLGICLPKGVIKALRRRLSASALNLDAVAGLDINISGCTNSCDQQIWADLGFSGRIGRVDDHPYPAYTVYARINGRRQLGKPLGYISARDLPAFVEDFLSHYISKQSEYADYDEYIQQEGAECITKLIEKYNNIPSFDEDKNYYFDWGAQEIFSLAKHGQAECSAGLFDIIDIDLGIIAEKQSQLANATDKSPLLHDIVFSASRMLLVTRGADPRNDDEVYDDFEHLFIDANLIDGKFKSVIELARNNIDLTSHEEEVKQLADSVKRLYEKMDDSLQFKVEETTPKKVPSNDSGKVTLKDFRGVACPMNFVKTKIALATLPSGALLEILLDDGQPINNVPGSVRGEGHTVISTNKEGDHWRVLIQKK